MIEKMPIEYKGLENKKSEYTNTRALELAKDTRVNIQMSLFDF